MNKDINIAAVISFKDSDVNFDTVCRILSKNCSALFILLESSKDETRNHPLELEKILPIVIYDSIKLSREQRLKKLLKISKNSIGIFPLDYFFYVDATKYADDSKLLRFSNIDRLVKRRINNENKARSFSWNYECVFDELFSADEIVQITNQKFDKFDKTINTLFKKFSNFKLFKKLQRSYKNIYDRNTGIFSAEFHKNNLYLDLPPFKYISNKYAPKTVLDIGCGLAGYIKYYKEWGSKEVLGVDGFPKNRNVFLPDSYYVHNLRNELKLNKRYDLVICVEVAEHIDSEFEDVLLNNIIYHSDSIIIFSAARINQPGIGHINCQEINYWIEKWERLGWEVNIFDTMSVRSLSTYLWFRNNLLVLQRSNNKKKILTSFERRGKELVMKKKKMDRWFNQPPNVYHYPLIDEAPNLDI